MILVTLFLVAPNWNISHEKMMANVIEIMAEVCMCLITNQPWEVLLLKL
jgi:hypothetical protein